MRPARIAAVATAAGMAVLAMSACGTEKADEASNLTVDAKTLAQQTQQKVKETKSVRIVGGGTIDTGDGETMELKAEMCFGADESLKGKVAYGKAELEVVATGGKEYVKGSRKAWDEWYSMLFDLGSGDVKVDRAAYDQMLGLLDNRWLADDEEEPADDDTASPAPDAFGTESPDTTAEDEDDDDSGGFGDLTDIQKLFGDDYDKVVKGDPVEYDGKRVIPLTVTDEETDEVTTVYVPEKGKQIPVRITYETPGTPDKADFKVTAGDGSCGAKAPSADQLVDKAAYDALEDKVFDFGFGDMEFDEEGTIDDAPAATGSSGAPTSISGA
ncbi:hypothetical protein OG216_39965 [Streptomycetaceae bacterium NBC_01309]